MVCNFLYHILHDFCRQMRINMSRLLQVHSFPSHNGHPTLHKNMKIPEHRNSGDLKQSRKRHSSRRKNWKYVNFTTSTEWRKCAVQINSSWVCKLRGWLIPNQLQFLACFLYRHGLCNSQCPCVRPSIRQTCSFSRKIIMIGKRVNTKLFVLAMKYR